MTVYKFTSIDRALDFAKSLLVEGDKKVEIKTVYTDCYWEERFDHYLVIVSDNELKKEE